jgi:hypothetical protein
MMAKRIYSAPAASELGKVELATFGPRMTTLEPVSGHKSII